MIKVAKIFSKLCQEADISVLDVKDCRSYDSSTLFCPAGMQRYLNTFKNPTAAPILFPRCTIQPCLRLNDLDEISDGTHYLHFHMLGLFSFNVPGLRDEWGLYQACTFWHEFISRLKLKVCHVTVHPDKMEEWKGIHPPDIKVLPDEDCKWELGGISGYCTEYYVMGEDGIPVEVGNVVNPGGNCIDCGFGLERLDILANKYKPAEDEAKVRLSSAIRAIRAIDVVPSNNLQGYALRKLIRLAIRMGISPEPGDRDIWKAEEKILEEAKVKFERLYPRYQSQPKEWWWDTHGIRLEEMDIPVIDTLPADAGLMLATFSPPS